VVAGRRAARYLCKTQLHAKQLSNTNKNHFQPHILCVRARASQQRRQQILKQLSYGIFEFEF
jgi:hypothetical protein